MALKGRNESVEQAVHDALARIDEFVLGATLQHLPSPNHRRAIEDLLQGQRASVRTAMLFLMFYRLVEPNWSLDDVPVGVRGTYGDKLLSEELTQRDITLHGPITAFAENLGWKGNVRNVNLSNDPRFNGFLAAVRDADDNERRLIADFLAQQFAASRRTIEPLPPVGHEVLTFARAKSLFYTLLGINSEGFVQQFLIASLLFVYRRREGIEVRTHHPHAADRYDETAGDIEDWRGAELIRAYEVTVRDDWKNRISNFKLKMDQFRLPKYVIIARGINIDPEWSVPADTALKLEPYGRDIAVLDIQDVLNFLASEMTPQELREVVNKGFDYLSDRGLAGRDEFRRAYREAVRDWLDTVDDAPGVPDGKEAEGQAG